MRPEVCLNRVGPRLSLLAKAGATARWDLVVSLVGALDVLLRYGQGS